MEGVRVGANVGIPRAFFREALNLALEAVKARRRSRTAKAFARSRRLPKKKR
jgi:hypothetical protein